MELYNEYEHKKAELQYNHEQEMSNLKEKYTNEESDLKKSLSVNMKNLKNEKSIIVEKRDALNSKTITANFNFSDFDNIASEEYKNK